MRFDGGSRRGEGEGFDDGRVNGGWHDDVMR